MNESILLIIIFTSMVGTAMGLIAYQDYKEKKKK